VDAAGAVCTVHNVWIADPDPSLHFGRDLDPTFHFNADPDPDPAPHQSDANDPPQLPITIVSVHGPPWHVF
jgi:hypothetical protein